MSPDESEPLESVAARADARLLAWEDCDDWLWLRRSAFRLLERSFVEIFIATGAYFKFC